MKNIYESAYLLEILPNDTGRFGIVKKMFEEGINASETEKYEIIIKALNIAYVDEWLAELNYFSSYNLSKTEGKSDFDPEFEQHEDDERKHREDIVNRLRELESPTPVVLLQNWIDTNSRGDNWKQELSQVSTEILLNRYNEEIEAIEFYNEFLKFLKSTDDTTTYKLIRSIKADEEEHAKDLRDLLSEYNVEF